MEGFASENVSSGSNITNGTSVPGPHQLFVVPTSLKIGVTFFAVVIFVVALIGNTIILYIVCSCRHMRNTTNILIANMAVADLWITIDIPYVIKWLFVGRSWFGGVFGKILCQFCHSAQAGSIACSIFTLVCISLDRSLAILFPMKNILTIRIVKIMITVVWLLTLAFLIPLFIVTDVIESPIGYVGCNEVWENMEPVSYRNYIFAFSLCTYAFPLTLITAMYTLTGLRLWNRKVPGHRSLRVHKRIQSSTKRATAMLITVVVVFAICWFPFQIRELIESFGSGVQIQLPLTLFILLPWFGFANAAINPILYFVFSENYRREFKRTFTRMSRRRRRSSSSQVSRGMTLRTRISLSTSVPLQKLRNDSYIPADSQPSHELFPKRTHPDISKSDSPKVCLMPTEENLESESVCGSMEGNTSENIEIDITMDNGHC
ncbi:prolactin-releasing peptide receptor-like [Actinia tenebrosa]|uniref:Prolactin-releasing peptide receptor-like n=1 Tax=Actinia tenebrosa TaxID=6105 RepID=A0A6P8HH68_ACTTE|nr:prolactin-releasing peptide receptor-like [Actinia tenebrosa]XP_031555192.1 prolactin-releasing peptide receptor-like [Actinia tenebrosa]XP_031555194.1 prolactin-releasing peptide receptor-like [Actinia tenebrosa]XP_031555195.1 prolactin-releasing peptide receptor-like [Actinia tenebrosa]XP_031555196.1 prolactin-releasing peptide receptor-like [Actinia tenebrosa]XP_031555197.1 prolactin-releasing peptide receptor-like [Actinia tenebrosa]XP_031555198.1 prolactin-releasing peptide receptor-l